MLNLLDILPHSYSRKHDVVCALRLSSGYFTVTVTVKGVKVINAFKTNTTYAEKIPARMCTVAP